MTTLVEPKPATARPEWFTTLATKKNKGETIMFLIWGGIDDYVHRGLTATRYLGEVLAGTRERPGADVVLRYSLDQGITFASPSQERLYRTTLGLDAPSPAAAPSTDQATAFAALRKASGQPAPGALPSAPDEALEQIIRFLKLARHVDGEPKVPGGARHAAAIIERLDSFLADADKATLPESRSRLAMRLHRASLDRDLLHAGNPLFLLAPALEDVSQELRRASSGVRDIEIPLPDNARRLNFICELIDTCLTCSRQRAKHNKAMGCIFAPEVELAEGLTPEELANITAGLYLRHIEDIAMLARGGQLTRDMALTRQAELMRLEYSDGLRRLEPTVGYEVLSGIDYLVEWFRTWVIAPMRSGLPQKKRFCPMGVALAGPPGTGKTIFARATAKEAGINAVELLLTKDKYVGESAKKLAKQIRGIKAFTPCLVFVDEYDKFLAGSEGADNSTDAELRKMWQEFSGDTSHRGEIFLQVATNYPENILPALARKGRIDYFAPMLAPGTPAERLAILSGHATRQGLAISTALLTDLADRTAGWTGMDLEAAVVKACGLVEIMGMTVSNALDNAIATLQPTDPLAVERMTRSALRFCNDLALLPPDRREQAKQVQREPEEPDTGTRRAGGLEL